MRFQLQPYSSTPIARRILALREEAFSDSPHLQALSESFLLDRANSFASSKRETLVDVLRDQYKTQGLTEAQAHHLSSLLLPKAVTMTCGHQLILGGGPLFVHSKIREVSVASTQWTRPERPVVPIFWMATEDHDVEEVRHILFNGKRYTMPNAFEGRAVGTIPAKAVHPVLERIERDWGHHEAVTKQLKVLKSAYIEGETLADATRRMMAHWHPDVLCLDPMDSRLKAIAKDLWKDEVQSQSVFENQNNNPWAKCGWEPPVLAKPSSLFYLHQGRRTRLHYSGDEKWDLGGERMIQEDLLKLIERHPESISPNALLRPVYQEYILPNVLYAGGAGEMEYWLQLIPYFKKKNLPKVRMHLRSSFEWWPEKAWVNWQKLATHGVSYYDTISEVRSKWLKEASAPIKGSYPLTELLEEKVRDVYGEFKDLDRSIASWIKRIANEEDRMRERARRYVLRTQSERWKAFLSVKSTQFPGSIESGGEGKMQERVWTVLDLAYHFGAPPFETYSEALLKHLNLHKDLTFQWVWLLPQSDK